MCYNCWKGRNVPALHDRIAQHLMRIDKSLQVVENLEDVSSSQIIFLNSDRPPSIRERAAVLEKLRMLHLQMLKRRKIRPPKWGPDFPSVQPKYEKGLFQKSRPTGSRPDIR